MKLFFAALSGFLVTIAIFAGGAFSAIWFLSAEPVPVQQPGLDTAGIWTVEPVRVDAQDQDYRRVDVAARGDAPDAATEETATGEVQVAALGGEASGLDDTSLVDPMTTASLTPEPDERESLMEAEAELPEPALDPRLVAAHVGWCSNRYRSYRPSDNSYNPYRGPRRDCISPYYEEIVTTMAGSEAPRVEDEMVASANTGSSYLVGSAEASEMPQGRSYSRDHIRECFARYRSYRVEDNSYQPYGGGPRRQCM